MRARRWLHAHEHGLAQVRARPTARWQLVRQLAARGDRLGILTRNLRELALLSLEAIGLADCFQPDDVLGRDNAPPKPDPAGLLQLAARWAVEPTALAMIGDFAYDLACARAVGATSVLVNMPGHPWPELTDWRFDDCHGLHAHLAP